jgi:serine/threonine-protein kinase
MEADRWKKIQELYEAAIALPPEKRADFLEQASPADDGLRGEVQSLLAQPVDSFLESAPLPAIKTLSAGARLGNFEIVELIGRGGMGEVYRARDSRLRPATMSSTWRVRSGAANSGRSRLQAASPRSQAPTASG